MNRVFQPGNGRDNRVAAIDFPLSETTTPRRRYVAWFAADPGTRVRAIVSYETVRDHTVRRR